MTALAFDSYGSLADSQVYSVIRREAELVGKHQCSLLLIYIPYWIRHLTNVAYC